MLEVIILLLFGLIWIALALIQDIQKREIDNWINYSLIIFILGFRFFYSLFSDTGNWSFFYNGLIGLGIFFLLGNALYYSRFFAGGDYRLFVALGTILPIDASIFFNLKIMLLFLVCFFVVGFVYLFISILVLGIKNFSKFKKEFVKQFIKYKTFLFLILALAILLLIFGFFVKYFFFLAIFCFLLGYLLIYVKTIDASCMIKSIYSKDLTEGDWICQDIKIGKKSIKASWDGLTKDQIKLIKKTKKKVLIRIGVAFAPVFLISFILWMIFMKLNFIKFLIF